MQLLQQIHQHHQSQKTAISHYIGQGRYTELRYADLCRHIADLSHKLHAAGLKEGDFMGLYMRRCPEQIIAMLACLRLGIVFFCLNPKLTHAQVADSLTQTQAKLLLLDNAALMRLQNINTASPTPIGHYSEEPLKPLQNKLIDKLKKTGFSVKIYPVEQQTWTVPADNINEKAALVLFTSGSTGQPKGVLIGRKDIDSRIAGEIADYQLTAEDRLLSLLPFSFDVGLNQVCCSLNVGAELVLLNSWLPPDICNVSLNRCITGISGVPSLWTSLLADNSAAWQAQVSDSFKHLRYLTISGGNLPVAQIQQLQTLIKPAGIYKTYGQTEAFRASMLKPHDIENYPASVGKVLKGVEISIVTETGKPAKQGESGTVLYQGDGMMLNYLNAPEASAEKCIPHPFYADQYAIDTGDIGYLDENGYLFLHGRKDQMLKIQGNRVYPQEVLNVLQAHSTVQEAVVVGGINAQGETILCAEYMNIATEKTDLQNVKIYLKQHLPSYMQPAILEVVTAFPRTASGKISLADIKKRYNLDI